MLQLLGPLAALLGVELTALRARITRNAIAYGALAFCGVIAFVFLLVALHAAMSLAFGPVWSALIMALVAGLAAAGIWIWMQSVERKRQRDAEKRRHTAEATALAGTAALSALPMLKRVPWYALAAALPVAAVAGYLFYVRTGSRRR